MTAFLFLQKFDGGVPAMLPYVPVMARLALVGKAGRGRGDMEITLPADAVAATCTVIGSAEEGIACIGFERPRFDAALRELVWDCMEQFGCTVFDDILSTVYTTLRGRTDVPASLMRASQTGARAVSSAQQLWPADFEIGQQSAPRPALRYPNANPNGPDLQLFDYAGPDGNDMYIDIAMGSQACNPGTLRVLRNVELRVDAAISGNPSYAVMYRYSERETSLLVLESAKVGERANRATMPARRLANRSGQLVLWPIGEFLPAKTPKRRNLPATPWPSMRRNSEAGMPDIEALAGLLDQAHAAYGNERDRHGEGTAFSSAGATAWARMAGGYLGHFIAQQVGAQWGYVSRAQQRMLVLRTHSGRICCPHHLVLDHVITCPAFNSAITSSGQYVRVQPSGVTRSSSR